MNATGMENLERDLRSAAKELRYPPTPSISAAVVRRLRGRTRSRIITPRWSWALITVFVVLTALMLVPPARAAIIDFIQIGVVRIFRGPGLPPAPPPTPGIATPALQAPVTATPASPLPSATSPSPLGGLAGETTLADAEAHAGFRVLLPTYPPDLGAPDRVYLQELGETMLFFVWLEPDRSGHVRMSLQEIPPGSWTLGKYGPRVIQEVTVNGQKAIWAEGPYMLQTRNGDYEERRMIAGHVLIWERDTITYRLETGLSLDEAIQIAESLAAPQSSDAPIPGDLPYAHTLVQRLRAAGIAVQSVQHSVVGSLFDSANEAGWIKTDVGIADAVFFVDPTESEHIQVTSLQSQDASRHVYRIQAPPPTMLEARTIDAAFPLFFEVGHGMFIQTDSAGLDQALQRILAEMTGVPGTATEATHAAFSLSREQAQEIAVLMNFMGSYNRGQLDEALTYLDENVGISDCDYQNARVTTFQGQTQASLWLQGRIADHDQLEVGSIENANLDPVSGGHVLGVDFARRRSLTLTGLGFDDGIIPKLAAKVIFTPEPTLIGTFANGPQGGDPGFCTPGI